MRIKHIKKKTIEIILRLLKYRSSHQRCSVRKGVLRNFAKFTGKDLCQSHFFNKVAGLRTPFLQNTSGRLLLEIRKTT